MSKRPRVDKEALVIALAACALAIIAIVLAAKLTESATLRPHNEELIR